MLIEYCPVCSNRLYTHDNDKVCKVCGYIEEEQDSPIYTYISYYHTPLDHYYIPWFDPKYTTVNSPDYYLWVKEEDKLYQHTTINYKAKKEDLVDNKLVVAKDNLYLEIDLSEILVNK